MALLNRSSALLRALARCEGSVLDALRPTSFTGLGSQNQRQFSAVTGIDISEEWFMRQRKMIVLGNKVPTKSPDTWIAPSAVIVGDVDLLDKVSVWYGAVLRGDLNNITVGSNSTIQDRTVIHAARTSPSGLSAATVIGKNVIIEPACVLRSCRVGNNCIVGARSSLLEGSMMEDNSILAPGSVVPPARRIPSGELWAGNPAKFVRKLSKDEMSNIVELAERIRAIGYQAWSDELPYGTAWREVEEFRANRIKAGNYSEIDIRSERYNARLAAEREAVEKLS